MIKKISDKDKQDWDNFLNNKKLPPNKDYIKKKNIRDKKTIEISDKDKQDWENFLKKKRKYQIKILQTKKTQDIKK